jgi:IclR family transcriptional regulator, pca regulon regulatory protein
MAPQAFPEPAGEPAVTVAPQDEFAAHLGNPNFVLSLARGLRVIEAFDGAGDGATVGELSQRTGLSRASVRRILVTLEMLGYAESTGRAFRLKTRVMRLSGSYLSSNSLATMAQAVMDQVTQVVEESSSVSVLDNDEIVFLARSTAKRVLSTRLAVGSRLPAYCTSMGRVLLAGLTDQELAGYFGRVKPQPLTPKTITDRKLLTAIIKQVREDGFALLDEELELGLRSIAVPIIGAAGRTVAAMNIGVHASRVSTAEMMHRFLPVLREQSRTLGRLL